MNNAVGIATEGINVSKSSMEEYLLSSKRMQDSITVRNEIISFKIMYLGKEEYDEYTIIKKSLSSQAELKDVVIMENIPKEVARKASQIYFDQQPEVLKEDPVVQWSVPGLSYQEITYRVEGMIDAASARNIRTIVLPKQDFKLSDTVENSGRLTGFLAFENLDLSQITFVHWFIIIGVWMRKNRRQEGVLATGYCQRIRQSACQRKTMPKCRSRHRAPGLQSHLKIQ